MSKLLHSQFTLAISICAFLSVGACTNQLSTPTQTIVHPSPQATETVVLPVPTWFVTPTMSTAQQATLEIQNSVIATRDAQVATDIAIVPNCGWSGNHNYSPDGNWVAFECLERGIGVYNLKDFSKSWYFSYDDTFGSRYESSNPPGRLLLKRWSVDGKYLYFAPFFGGDGGCVYYAEAQALFKLDLSSGNYSEILSPTDNLSYYNFSFSNNDRYLGYFEVWQEIPVLNLYNLASNEQQEILLGGKYSGAGYLIWSQDNTQVLFSARSGEECESMVYYLILLNFKDYSQKIVFEGDNVIYFPVRWVDEKRVLVETWFSEEYFYFDILSGEFLPYNQDISTSKP